MVLLFQEIGDPDAVDTFSYAISNIVTVSGGGSSPSIISATAGTLNGNPGQTISASTFTVTVTVDSAAESGARDLFVEGATLQAAAVVYRQIDRIVVAPVYAGRSAGDTDGRGRVQGGAAVGRGGRAVRAVRRLCCCQACGG